MTLTLGIDENGLGPQLGPLVATGLLLRQPEGQAAALTAWARDRGLADSKQTAGFGRMRASESLTLALVEGAGQTACTTVDVLWDRLLLQGPDTAPPCPNAATARQCHSAPITLPAFGGSVAEGRAQLKALARRGVQLSWLRSTTACAGVLNAAQHAGQSRVQVDLQLFERLIVAAKPHCPDGALQVECGMVSGIRDYPKYLRTLQGCTLDAAASSSARRVYHWPGGARIAFSVHAEAGELAVALASMVGKYVRELSMHRITAFYRGHDPSLAAVSGYHDPNTRRFVAASAPLRRRLHIPDSCFVRRTARC
ncbi:MAG: hypothetical protein ACPGUV_13975 [Polyangiales bacterium]